MNMIRPLALAITLALVGSAAWAEKAHHPENAASAAKATKAPKAAPSKAAAKETMNKMDQQTQAMHAMHEKMMNAKTPQERSALMAEHMKTMMGGMSMMGSLAGEGKDSMKGAMPSDMATRHQMMEKRMEMMEATMQMMMDRMTPPATQ